MPRFALAGLLFLLPAAARADGPPALTLRELTVRAGAVVVAEPAGVPGRFRVTEALQGAAPRPGEVVEVADLGQYLRPREEPDPARVDAALLFLSGAAGEAGLVRGGLVPSGAWLHTRDERVWVPVRPREGGGYRMGAGRGVTWTALLLQARADAAAVNRVLAARELPGPRRTAALLDWVERHRSEFAGSERIPQAKGIPAPAEGPAEADLRGRGWGELERQPLVWALQGGTPAEAWRALQVYAELNEGACAPEAVGAFASRAGRRLLVDVARDGGQLQGARARALKLLAAPGVYAAAGGPLSEAEHTELLDGLLPLLADKSSPLRGLAALAVGQVCSSPGRGNPPPERALAALAKAYKAEPPGPARNALAATAYDLGGAERWRGLSGQPHGLFALLADLGQRDGKVYFWLAYRSDGLKVFECPSLVLERVDEGGKPQQTKSVPLPATAAPAWAQGWAPGGLLHAELSVADLKPGTWRLRVTGKAGPDKVPWSSEPRTFQIVVPGAPPPERERSVWAQLFMKSRPEPPRPWPQPENPALRRIVLDGEPL
jgi:hypothetical protein